MRSPEMQSVMRQAAERAMEFAKTISPVRTGHYADSFEVTVVADGGPRGERAEARLTNTAAYAVNVEWQDNRKVLTRTLGALEHLL